MRVIPCSPATKQRTSRRSILIRLAAPQVVVDRRNSYVTSVMLIKLSLNMATPPGVVSFDRGLGERGVPRESIIAE